MDKSKNNQEKVEINNENRDKNKLLFKTKEALNVSNMTRDVGMNDIIDQIGNLMKKFANEVNVQKADTTEIEGNIIKINFLTKKFRKSK